MHNPPECTPARKHARMCAHARARARARQGQGQATCQCGWLRLSSCYRMFALMLAYPSAQRQKGQSTKQASKQASKRRKPTSTQACKQMQKQANRPASKHAGMHTSARARPPGAQLHASNHACVRAHGQGQGRGRTRCRCGWLCLFSCSRTACPHPPYPHTQGHKGAM